MQICVCRYSKQLATIIWEQYTKICVPALLKYFWGLKLTETHPNHIFKVLNAVWCSPGFFNHRGVSSKKSCVQVDGVFGVLMWHKIQAMEQNLEPRKDFLSSALFFD